VRRRKRGQEAKEDLARVQGKDTSGGWVEKARNRKEGNHPLRTVFPNNKGYWFPLE